MRRDLIHSIRKKKCAVCIVIVVIRRKAKAASLSVVVAYLIFASGLWTFFFNWYIEENKKSLKKKIQGHA